METFPTGVTFPCNVTLHYLLGQSGWMRVSFLHWNVRTHKLYIILEYWKYECVLEFREYDGNVEARTLSIVLSGSHMGVRSRFVFIVIKHRLM